ncbi:MULTISPECIES: flavodoxin [Stenotrophomonas]|uniref:flavodoxin n=1 Tax=Stenotrophomonas TaxID=40323 RepID=UPI0021C9C14A|nr:MULTISPECIES: flavodoxin [Stenotrophomonas]
MATNERSIDRYHTVMLGYPILGESLPPVIASFLSAHSLAGKKLYQFVTHGGYGLGRSQRQVIELAPDANLELTSGWHPQVLTDSQPPPIHNKLLHEPARHARGGPRKLPTGVGCRSDRILDRRGVI